MRLVEAARAWQEAGVSVIPIHLDGTKRPAVAWSAYQRQIADDDTLAEWFAGDRHGLAVICGQVSGNLEMTELEGGATNGECLDKLQAACDRLGILDIWAGLTNQGYMEATPSGGIHFLYRVEGDPIPGNTKLAWREARQEELNDSELRVQERMPDKKFYRVLSETRGEGGYVIVAPTPGSGHPSGEEWGPIVGASGVIPTLSREDRDLLHAAIREALDEMPAPIPVAERRHTGPVAGSGEGLSPGDDFNRRADWADILDGEFEFAYEHGGIGHWKRIGSEKRVGATTNALGTDRLKVWTTSTIFTDESLSKFGAYATLHHGGDYAAAARELRRLGYGTQQPVHPATIEPPDELPRPPALQGIESDIPEMIVGQELPAPHNPLAVAQVLMPLTPRPWRQWRDDWYEWTGSHWQAIDPGDIRNWIYRVTANSWYLKEKKGEDEPKRVPWSPTKRTVDAVLDALGIGTVYRASTREDDAGLALGNGILDPTTRTLSKHTAARFNLHSLPFDYDPAAECPQWMEFLDSVLPGDTEAHEFLAEWFGYVLSGRTDLQKMAVLTGPTRSGKGTIADILAALIGGDRFISSPGTMASLGSHFGAEGLIGKKLMLMGDVRWDRRDATEAVPLMLGITGEDRREVPRKNRSSWQGKLGCRIMLMSNESPNFKDVSSALANRMMHLEFRVSFLGREDIGLGSRLLKEMAGIFNWALDGLDRLTQRGHFRPPASGRGIDEDVHRDSSPYAAFVEDCATLGEGREEHLPNVVTAYVEWCRKEGRHGDAQNATASSVSRGIRAAFRDKVELSPRRVVVNGVKVRVLTGLSLNIAIGSGMWLANSG